MAAAMKRLKDDPELRRSLAEKGLETIRARHTCGHRADELLGIVGAPGRACAPAERCMKIAFTVPACSPPTGTERRLIIAAAARSGGPGYDITFYEPDAFDRQQHRDIDPPEWARPSSTRQRRRRCAGVLAEATGGRYRRQGERRRRVRPELLEGIVEHSRPDALRIFWDVDAAATLEEMRADDSHVVRRMLPQLDMVLTYGGGPPVIEAYRGFGAARCVPIYNALDPTTHHPVAPDERFASDLAFLGNRLPDREARVEEFFLKAAASLPERSFLIGGNGWETKEMPGQRPPPRPRLHAPAQCL
jgi:spore maturation protein CgeB